MLRFAAARPATGRLSRGPIWTQPILLRCRTLRAAGIIAARGGDLGWRHPSRHVAHLLVDIVSPRSIGESTELGAKIVYRLALKPRRAGFTAQFAMTSTAPRDIAPRGTVGDDPRRPAIGRGLVANTWQIGIVSGEITHIALAQVRHQRHHDRAASRAAPEVRQLLVDRPRILPGEIRRIRLTHAARAVAHGAAHAQRRAAANRLR